MINLEEFQLKRFFARMIFLIIVSTAWQLLFTVPLHAQVSCEHTKAIKLNMWPYGESGLGTNCFIVSIPRFTATVEVELLAHSANNSYSVYWQDRDSSFVLIASNLLPSLKYFLRMPHETKNSERLHMLAVVPQKAQGEQDYILQIYAKNANGNLQYEKVGAESGTVGGSLPQGGNDIPIKVPARTSVRTKFSAKCGKIYIDAQWPFEVDNSSYNNYRVNLYAPNNQRVHSVPIGQPTGNSFRLPYLISPSQVTNSDQWEIELINNNKIQAYVTLSIDTENENCPNVLGQTPSSPPSQTYQAGQVNTHNVNVRNGPGTNFAVVRQLSQNETVEVVDTSADQQWYQLSDGNWIAARFVSITSITAAQTRQITFQQWQSPSAAYYGVSDTTLEQHAPTTVHPNGSQCYVDGDDPPGSNLDRVTLLKWNISEIPNGSVVKSAWITLQVTDKTEHIYSLYTIRKGWSEAQATWQQAFIGTPWNVAGAQGDSDRDPTIIGYVGPVEMGKNIIRLNVHGIALVQGWVNSTIPNYGLRIADTTATDGVDFYCSQVTEKTLRPALTIEYTTQ